MIIAVFSLERGQRLGSKIEVRFFLIVWIAMSTTRGCAGVGGISLGALAEGRAE